MKIRKGHVSNSSSSSFIVALAKVVDKNKLDKFLEEFFETYNIDEYKRHSFKIVQLKDIPEDDIDGYSKRLETRIRTTCLNDDFTVDMNYKGMNENDRVFSIVIINDEGDQSFYSNDYGFTLNHDIDLDFFPKWQQEVWGKINKDPKSIGIKDVKCNFGAGRNG